MTLGPSSASNSLQVYAGCEGTHLPGCSGSSGLDIGHFTYEASQYLRVFGSCSTSPRICSVPR